MFQLTTILIGCFGCTEVSDETPAETTARVIAGGTFNCMLSTEGSLWCQDYERADGKKIRRLGLPREHTFVDVVAGAYSACGLTEEGEVKCWGHDNEGYVTETPEGTWESIHGNNWGTCATAGAGDWTCWGNPYPQETGPPQGQRFLQLEGADWSFCGITESQELLCWGRNDIQQAEPPLGTYTEIVAGDIGYSAKSTEGEWVWWGRNWYGEGDIPTDIEIIDLAFGSYHGCALDPQGKVHCWGAVDPDGEEPYRWQLDVPEDETFVSIDANLWHTCGVTTEGDVRCWGCNTWRFPDYWEPEDHCNDPVPPWDR